MDIDRWIAENSGAPLELYRPSKEEKKLDMYALYHSQYVGKRHDKEATTSVEICF